MVKSSAQTTSHSVLLFYVNEFAPLMADRAAADQSCQLAIRGAVARLGVVDGIQIQDVTARALVSDSRTYARDVAIRQRPTGAGTPVYRIRKNERYLPQKLNIERLRNDRGANEDVLSYFNDADHRQPVSHTAYGLIPRRALTATGSDAFGRYSGKSCFDGGTDRITTAGVSSRGGRDAWDATAVACETVLPIYCSVIVTSRPLPQRRYGLDPVGGGM